MRRLLTLLMLVGMALGQGQAPPSTNKYVPVLAIAGQTATGSFAYYGVDPSGNLYTSGSPGIHAQIGGYLSPTAVVAQDSSGNWHYLQVDGSGNLKVSGSGGGGDTISSPNGTMSIGGTSTATTLDVKANVGCLPGSFAVQADAATVTWAVGSNMCANASLLFTVHSGSRTLNLTGMVNGGSYVLKLTQDSTGGEGLTLGTGCTWLIAQGTSIGYASGTITPTTSANGVNVLAWTYDGTNCLANFD
jgi:hypothetical protein